MACIIRAFWCVFVVLWAVCLFPSDARASPYLSSEIDIALSARVGFLQNLGLTEKDFLSFDSWIAARDAGQFSLNLADLGETHSPWYYYISGYITEGEIAGAHYGQAVASAADDPGTLWLLALEFIRHNHLQWAAHTLTALEKNMFARGGTAFAPFLSMQLMLMGNAAVSPEQANFCYEWAKHFDAEQPWWLYRKSLAAFPRNVISTAPSFIADAVNVLLTSWRAQLALLYEAYRFISVTLLIFICALFLIFAAKHLSSGVHPVGDTLFSSASPRFRTISSIVVVLSLLPLGLQPVMWAIAFLAYRFLNSGEKKLLIAACVLLAVSPLNFYTQRFLQRGTVPASSAVLLDRALREGYSVGLYNAVYANAQNRPYLHTAQLALAVSAAKGGAYELSATALDKALHLAPLDPVVLLCAGNIAFLKGDIPNMERFYGDLIKKQPNNATARFNFAQAYDGFAAANMLSEAARLNAGLLSNFSRENERHFSEDGVPPLRRVIWPTVTSGYFWKNLFFANPTEVFEAKSATGLNPLAAFSISALLLAVFMALCFTVWSESSNSKVKKYFICRICGRLLCKKCRKGTMCSVCYKECLSSSNNAATMHNLQIKYMGRTQMQKDITRYILGALIPGSDKLFIGETAVKPILLLLLTCAIFAAYYCAFTFRTAYPDAVTVNLLHYVPILLIYNITAIVKQSIWLSETLRLRAKMAGK